MIAHVYGVLVEKFGPSSVIVDVNGVGYEVQVAAGDFDETLLDSKVTSLAYETLDVNGSLPLLKPMSEIAGRLSIQEAAKYMEKPLAD
jgi:alanine dehydrogenase